MASEDQTKGLGEIRIGGTTFEMMCSHGHVWTEESSSDRPFHLTLTGTASGTISTGPLCIRCLVELLNERAGAIVISATPKC